MNGLLVGSAIFLPVAVYVAYTDFRQRRIPNKALLAAILISPLGWFLAPPNLSALWLVSICLLIGFWSAYNRKKMGAGDVKYILTGMAAFASAPLVMPLSVIFTAIVASPFRKQRIPFATFNVFGLLAALYVMSAV